MKRIRFELFLITILFSVLPGVAIAQKPIAIGITAGVNISTEDYNIQNDTGRETRKGLILTGQTDWPLYGTAVLQDRLSYIQKGIVTHRMLLLESEQVTSELNYIELSLCPKVKFGTYDFKPYFFFGPRLSLLVSGDQVTQRGSMTTTQDFRSNYSSWDFGLDMGAGFSYPLVPRLYFLADGSFSWGLSNILKNDVAGASQAFSRDLKFQAGFMLEVFDVSPMQ